MSDESSHHIFNHNHKIAIFVAVFVTIILCAIILIQQDSGKTQNTINKIQEKTEVIELENNYSSQVKVILQNYLDARSSENFNCLQEVNLTVTDVLNLTVPLHLKAFHLELVILLDKEKNNCETQSQDLDDDWEIFLNKYDWLNK